MALPNDERLACGGAVIARYDLSVDMNSHDFFHWLQPAAALGAKEIVLDISRGFRRSKWPPDETLERYRTIVRPGAALLGLPCREGRDGERVADYQIAYHIQFARKSKNRPMPRLFSPLPAKNVRYTVTLRQQPKVHLHRNSNVEAWTKFAREIGALIIPDYVVKPIDLYERLALYAGAEMNFGVDNGPMSILSMTNYPMMTFKYGRNAEYLSNSGLEEPQKFPWCLDNQHMFWEDDELDNIRRRFEEWQSARAA